MAKLILGLAGEMGSGKGSATKYVVDTYGARSHKFSQILRDILDRLHVEQTRENIANVSLTLRKSFGEDILAKAMYHDAFDDQQDVVVIDGIRRMEDMKYLKELPIFKFIYVEADLETRYARIQKRSENGDEMKKTLEQFKAAHQYETETTIPDLRNYADYVLENNGTYADMYKKIDEIVKINLK